MGAMVITRAVPRVEYLRFHAPLPDTTSWKLHCGREYERNLRHVRDAVSRKIVRANVRNTVRAVKGFADYADFERSLLAELGPLATPGRIDAVIAKAARAWRARRIGA